MRTMRVEHVSYTVIHVICNVRLSVPREILQHSDHRAVAEIIIRSFIVLVINPPVTVGGVVEAFVIRKVLRVIAQVGADAILRLNEGHLCSHIN